MHFHKRWNESGNREHGGDHLDTVADLPPRGNAAQREECEIERQRGPECTASHVETPARLHR